MKQGDGRGDDDDQDETEYDDTEDDDERDDNKDGYSHDQRDQGKKCRKGSYWLKLKLRFEDEKC